MVKMTGKHTDFAKQCYDTRLAIAEEVFPIEEKVQPYWEQLLAAFDAMGGTEIDNRRREAQRLLRENGVTYNVYGDDKQLTRPWRLDPVPLLISGEEWLKIEAGLKQRAQLLDLILQDIYGKQLLLKKGLLPYELVLAHSGFLPACVGSVLPQATWLTVYSANLVRGHKGQLWVVDDRTQAPSGCGYALENRAVMTRILPEIFRETQVARLSSFFKLFQQSLSGLAQSNKENPRVVVLTPGPFNETYFEHAYLASYLGYTLVQGDDLTVRDGRVWLKALAGLQPVDVILRRVDDVFCDPLSLRNDSRLGIPGLLEVVRRGNVAIANPLGSSVLENPALLAFLPRLARHFLNQELLLPSVATWWCGQRRECDFVIQNLDKLIIKQINGEHRNEQIIGQQLSQQEKSVLRAKISAKPYLFVGQESLSFATVPAFVDHHIEPRRAVLRHFVVAERDQYHVMPGGLTRVAREKNDAKVSNQEGGISKDTWVLGGNSDSSANALPNTVVDSEQLITNGLVKKTIWRTNQPLESVSEPVTSRAADHLFWVGRYLERTDSAARLLRSILLKYRDTLEFNDHTDAESLGVLLSSLTQMTATYPGFLLNDHTIIAAPEAELFSLAQNRQRSGSLAATIYALVQSAFSIRDLWSQDTWRSIDAIRHRWQQKVMGSDLSIEVLQSSLDELITGVVGFAGLTHESMTHEAGWFMLESGRRLERALNLTALLRATLVTQQAPAIQNQVLEAVLLSLDSVTIYQRRYRSGFQLALVLELLLLDSNHPRSIVYQLQQLAQFISKFPRDGRQCQLCEEERLILKALTNVQLSTVAELLKEDENSAIYTELENLLADTTVLLWQIAEVITRAYFSHSQISQLVTVASPNAEDEDL